MPWESPVCVFVDPPHQDFNEENDKASNNERPAEIGKIGLSPLAGLLDKINQLARICESKCLAAGNAGQGGKLGVQANGVVLFRIIHCCLAAKKILEACSFWDKPGTVCLASDLGECHAFLAFWVFCN